MGMWTCQVCGSDNREKDDYETWVQIICEDCGAIHVYHLDKVTKISEKGEESSFDWRNKED